MYRFVTILASLAILGTLTACGGCNVRVGPKPVPPVQVPPPNPIVQNPNVPANPNVPQPAPKQVEPPRDPAVAAIEARKGRLVFDDTQPDRPVVEADLTFTKMSDADLKSLASFTKLRKLSLSQNRDLTGAGFKDLAGLHDLAYLDVSSTKLDDEGMIHIAALKNLKFLSVSNTKIADPGMRAIAKLGQLEELRASGLLLNGPKQNEPTDAAIADLGVLKQLHTAVLDNSLFGDLSAKAFSSLDRLKKLDVYGTRVTDAGMVDLAKLKQLEELRIGYRIGDKGVNALTGHTQLKILSVWNSSGVTDASVKGLTPLTGLRQLDLGLTRISAKGLADIRQALPQCKVTKKK